MSLTLATGIGFPSRSDPDSGVQLLEQVLGQREVPGGEAGRQRGIPGDDGLGQLGMLAKRAPPDLGAVRLGVEAEAHLAPDVRAQLHQPGVVRRPGDRPVQGGRSTRTWTRRSTSSRLADGYPPRITAR